MNRRFRAPRGRLRPFWRRPIPVPPRFYRRWRRRLPFGCLLPLSGTAALAILAALIALLT